MLYKRVELIGKNQIALERYLYKFLNRRHELNKLKWHEKDFFYEHLQILRNNNGRYAVDIYSIPEAQDYVLYKLILIYVSNNYLIDFNKKSFDYNGEIPKDERNRHKKIFFSLMNKWTAELNKGKGKYLMVITPLFNRKLKELQELKVQRKIGYRTYSLRYLYMRATFYHIYYIVRKYFDEMKIKTEYIAIDGINFYADIYTYAHILTRHYYPKMNSAFNVSLNEDIPSVDVWNLPCSLLNLIKLYSTKGSITKSTEYLLFLIDKKKYILWIKYDKIAILGNIEGMEIRSFYCCEEQYDLCKFEGKSIYKVDEYLSIVC